MINNKWKISNVSKQFSRVDGKHRLPHSTGADIIGINTAWGFVDYRSPDDRSAYRSLDLYVVNSILDQMNRVESD